MSVLRTAKLFAVIALIFNLWSTQDNSKNRHGQQEQSKFICETDIDPVQRPIQLPERALRILSKDDRVASCLEYNELKPEDLRADWFVASEIHLDGPNERDVIVLAGDRLPDTPPGEPSQNACLMGANTAQFWVLRETASGFVLVLSEPAHDLEVLRTRTKGFRDVRLSAATARSMTILTYRFNGRSYEIAKRTSELIE
jgi:hypothetical protein